MTERLTIRGVEIFGGLLGAQAQRAMLEDIRTVVAKAPLFQPDTPYGKKMSVRISAAGTYGWFSDRTGYRYVDRHPTGVAWPEIPQSVLAVWREVTGLDRLPECCLINYYDVDARMGMHQDRDEADFSWPVVSISLGDDGLFRIGNLTRGGRTESIWLRSGDVVMIGGEARLTYHGVDRVKAGTSTLLRDGGRVNLTLRVVE